LAQTLGLRDLSDATSLGIQRYLTGLSETMKPTSVHHYFRPLKTFFRWCVETGLLSDNPVRGITIRVPRTLPRVPEDDDVRRLLQACRQTFEGRRNRALIALLADSGLRISEALRLRIENVNFSTRTLEVRGGKGGKDGVGFFGAEAAQMLRTWLAARREVVPEDFLFVDRMERTLTRHHAAHILHRLSIRAGFARKIGPHALRHYAATSILKQTGDLELVRQVMRHESLAMTLRYAQLTKPDVSRKFRRASPLDNLRAGR
jgi:integrase/recombinase XerD